MIQPPVTVPTMTGGTNWEEVTALFKGIKFQWQIVSGLETVRQIKNSASPS